ncbi:MAG: hypothetical protein QGG88_02915 [Gammaproteobacteria bacterium]|jgi:hypothetical protein|nr:hypothetical protein [Gammaproteobacteria bacterium]
MPVSPIPAQELQLLRNGYWDRTSIISLPDTSKRVRKISKGAESAGPWGMDNLRAEALYLAALEDSLQDFFPPLLAHWDTDTTGYDMGYMENYVNVGQIAQEQVFNQPQADAMQTYLGQRLFTQLHTPSLASPLLVANIKDTLNKAMHCLQRHAQLQVLLDPVSINHLPVVSLEQQLQALYGSSLLTQLDATPQVRLHGDLFLENMLLPAHDPGQNWPQHLVLIDPISVAGIGAGHPLFDLGKYESYATGELPAMRQERLLISGFEGAGEHQAPQQYHWAIDWQDPAMIGLKKINWHGQLRSLYIQHYGPVKTALYELLQAYFAAAMVVCTEGREQQARALKMRASLQLALTH